MAGVAAVVGNSHKALAPEIISSLASSSLASRPPETAPPDAEFIPVASLLASNQPASNIWVDDRFAHSFLEDVQLAPGHRRGRTSRFRRDAATVARSA